LGCSALQKAAITKGAILNISSNVDVFERGERYYRDGKLISYNAAEDTDGITNVRASVEGNYKNYDVSLKLDGSALSGYACSCESHSIWRGACKHVVAVLFAHSEGYALMFSEEKMRHHAQSLTENLEKIIFSGIDEALPLQQDSNSQASLLKLAPVLNSSPKGVFLTFTVGSGRMYVVKSISSFVKYCKNNETVSYGQGLAFSHRREMFDEISCKLIDFITREDDIYAEIGKRLSRQFQFTHHPLFNSRELFLTPRNIDEFFKIYENMSIECVSEFGNEVKLIDDSPQFGLEIRHISGGTVIQSQEFPHKFLHGEVSHYFLTENRFLRVSKADGQLLNSLLKTLNETPAREILFTGDGQQRFLSIILPQLMKMRVVESMSGDSPEGEVSALSAKMYFDTDGKDIIGRVEFHYGEVVIDVLVQSFQHTENTGREGIFRDSVSEYALRRRLYSHGFSEDNAKGVFRLKGNDLIYFFLHGEEHSGIESLRDCAEVFISEDLQNKTIRPSAPQIGLRISGNLLKVSLEESGYNISELLEALESYRTKKKFYRLKDGRFITLDNEAVAAAAGFLDALDVSKKEARGKTLSLPAYRALYIDELTKNDSLASTHALKRDENYEKLLSHFNNNEKLGFKIPKGLGTVLREYQKTGFKWLKTLAHYGFGGILADDMGLGKTLQMITLIASECRKNAPAIVIAPTSLLYNWENEIIKFAPQLKTQVISGLPEKRRELIKLQNIDIFITTYDMLKRDSEFYKETEFSFIIADEAQNIKNPATQAAKSVKELQGKVRFALTGTPIENTLTELWSIFDFIMPGYLYTAGKFSKLYETPIIKHNDRDAAAKLRKQIAPFVLRRVKKSVLKELPEKTETTLPAELTAEQKKIYQANLLEVIGVFDEIIKSDSFSDNRMRILAQLTRLRQICCHPSLFLENYNSGSGKLTLALETIQLALDSGHRVLLFSQFTQMLAIIKKELDNLEKPAKYFYLDGSTKSKERVEMTERFNAGECDIFLISLKAGGTGLNLTGADVVIHYDPWWNPSVMEQAADRAHRYGQKKAVQVFNIVAKDTIEEKIMELQEKKRGLIDSVITEGGSFINLLSEEEVRKLFT